MDNSRDITAEQHFRDTMWQSSVPYIKRVMLIAAVLFLLFWGGDYFIDSARASNTIPIRMFAFVFYASLYVFATKKHTTNKKLLFIYSIAAIAAPLFLLAIELQLNKGYILEHNTILVVLIAISIIGPYDRISIPLSAAVIVIPEIILYFVLISGHDFPGLPDMNTIAIYSIFHIGALLMVVGLIRIDTERHWYSYQEGRHLTAIAHTDPLTGIHNRRGLNREFEHEVKRQKRFRRQTAICLVDIDRFKFINDNYGHNIGDEVLQTLVQRWLGLIRETDTLARIGGEEFVVMLPETSRKQALDTAERLRTSICDTPVHTSANGLDVSVSIGIIVMEPGELDFTSAMSKADQAMYQAKNEGRNRVVLAD